MRKAVNVLNGTNMREKRAFHPRNLGGFSVVYTNKPGGKSLTGLIFEFFGDLPREGVSAKVAVGCGPLIQGFLQIQIPDDDSRPEIKVLLHDVK